MKSLADLAEYIKSVETFTPVAKELPGDRPGVFTFGYGFTDCKPGQCISEADATARLTDKLNSIGQRVDKLVKVPITDGQRLALIDFCFNCGAEALRTSTLLRHLNAGEYSQASLEFLVWNKADGKVLAGLTHRREIEKGWFEA